MDVARRQRGAQVFRITGARAGLADDVRGRQRRYLISMGVRTLSFVLAVLLWNVERHVAAVALVLGLVLPYVAVVIANAGRENPPSFPTTFVPAPPRPMLGEGGLRGEGPDGAPRPVPGVLPGDGAEPGRPEGAGPRRE